MRRAVSWAGWLGVVCAGVAGAQDPGGAQSPGGPSKASVAVLPFTVSPTVLRDADDSARAVIDEFETNALTNKFVTALVQTRKFDVVERERLDTLLQEMELSEQGLTDPARAVEAGQMLGADYFLMGEISTFHVTVEWRPIPNSTRRSRTITARIIADMRIVDARTSRIVAAETGEASFVDRSFHRDQIESVVSPASLDALQRDLVDQLVLRVVDAVYPIRIIAVGSELTLNRGVGGGLEVGEVLEVFSEGQELIDPDTGESLGFEEVYLGTIQVTEIRPRFSKAQLLECEGVPPRNAICRRVRGVTEEEPEPVETPQRGPRW